MKKSNPGQQEESTVKKGYNEKMPSHPQGTFPPDNTSDLSVKYGKNAMEKANAADKEATAPEKKANLQK